MPDPTARKSELPAPDPKGRKCSPWCADIDNSPRRWITKRSDPRCTLVCGVFDPAVGWRPL